MFFIRHLRLINRCLEFDVQKNKLKRTQCPHAMPSAGKPDGHLLFFLAKPLSPPEMVWDSPKETP